MTGFIIICFISMFAYIFSEIFLILFSHNQGYDIPWFMRVVISSTFSGLVSWLLSAIFDIHFL